MVKRKAKSKKRKKFYIEIKTNKRWKKVQLLSDKGAHLLVKLETGEIIKRRPSLPIHWGKTKKIQKKVQLDVYNSSIR